MALNTFRRVRWELPMIFLGLALCKGSVIG